jgi:hypothetical protein
MRLVAATLLLLLLLMGGCQPLPPGRLNVVAAASAARRVGHVYLLRGWRDLYSQGINRLAGEIKDAGIDAEAFRAAQWRQLAAAIINRNPPHSSEPLVLVGFSYGADDVLRIAEELLRHGITVDLAITIDPVTPPPVPLNIRACYNFFETNGIWDALPWLRGIPLHSAGAGRVINVDIRRDRPDLLEPDTSHANIAGNPKIHRVMIEKVLALCPMRNAGASTRPGSLFGN